jgi:hypothetical protein
MVIRMMMKVLSAYVIGMMGELLTRNEFEI